MKLEQLEKEKEKLKAKREPHKKALKFIAKDVQRIDSRIYKEKKSMLYREITNK